MLNWISVVLEVGFEIDTLPYGDAWRRSATSRSRPCSAWLFVVTRLAVWFCWLNVVSRNVITAVNRSSDVTA